MHVHIVDLEFESDDAVRQTASLLVEGFQDTGTEEWQTLEAGIAEVRESLQPGRISRVAVDENGDVQGWVGGIPQYNGHVWELHPLVVRADAREQGIGRMLVADLEREVRRRGGETLFIGTDDENGRTSIGQVDLYPDPLEKLLAMTNLGGHPFEFYRKVGFAIVGVIPDANGFGKPDILMAKRVSPGR